MPTDLNDNPTGDRFPIDSPVLVWFPPPGADKRDRARWRWLPATILSQYGEDEWYLVIEVPALDEPDPTMLDGDAPENVLYPACWRDSSEIRAITAEQWQRAWEEWGGR